MRNGNSKLVMRRDSLTDLPQLKIPEGYSLRSFQPSDVTEWENVIRISFAREIAFGDKIGFQPPFQPEKILFLCHQDMIVATAVAWEKEDSDPRCGYLHMVGALPGYSGQGLGYTIVLAALHRMREEGKRQAVLETDDFRLAAIRVYYKLGFLPVLLDRDHRDRWAIISNQLPTVSRRDL
ncbi:GNAT family N-acetyltransferase [Paenibacillus lutimineralis]|uniref:GNAT family N-acetyltransferase n=1 Tax=Paenibacillus lutimineralis TaxID=2707005 RepID=A0A3S9V5Q5_9BACL|nr:GNAT family N-acetyltransferase [Paenibacillus lutimineralis]AZS17868.1 GNAT family N-acetyltransferase [Paenibacillus lutimineralis]